MAAGQDRMLRASERLVADVEPAAIVDRELGEAQLLAAAEVARSYDEMMGTLVDTIA